MDEHDRSDEPQPTLPATHAAQDAYRSHDTEFSDFYRHSIVPLIGFLVVLGARPADAADVAQETMLKAYQDWNTITHPKAWVRRVASRAWGRHMARSHEDPVDQLPEHTSLLHPASGIEASGIEAVEQRHTVLQALATLPLRQRQVMAWTFDGYSAPEIAKELGIEPAAVRSSLLKARRSLTACLAQEGGPE